MSGAAGTVLTDEELAAATDAALERADSIEAEASPSRWEAADNFAELNDRGWTQQRIAERFETSQSSVSKSIACSKTYSVLNKRPSFWMAFAEVNAEKGIGVHGSSESDEWETPQDLFDELDDEFGFDLDVCATAENSKCKHHFTTDDDGLAQKWTGTCWMNPPYSGVETWVAKAHESAEVGATVVCLIPARPDTATWHEHARHGEIRFLRGRLKFGGSKNSAPFPSAVVVFGPDVEPSVEWWNRG